MEDIFFSDVLGVTVGDTDMRCVNGDNDDAVVDVVVTSTEPR